MTHNLITCNLENIKNRFNVRNSTVTMESVRESKERALDE